MSERGSRPSDRVLAALEAALRAEDDPEDGQVARVDTRRAERKGIPEVVFAANKTPGQVVDIVRTMLSASGRAIVSRARPEVIEALREAFGEAAVLHTPGTWTVVVRRPGCEPRPTGGRVAIFAAGTSDVPVAEEARVVAAEMGCEVRLVADVGVAGLHRLFPPLRKALDEGVDVIIVAAGMDGALPSVIAGLVPVPVIGLPTSVGYGFGGQGHGALTTMLQSCAPGLTVVNIDNGVGAGASAAMIANAVARARVRD